MKNRYLFASIACIIATNASANEAELLKRLEAFESRLSSLEAENKHLRAQLKKPAAVKVAAPVAPVPASTDKGSVWQGFYAGVNGGYGANTNTYNYHASPAALIASSLYGGGGIPFAGSEDIYFAGGTGGVQFGYNEMLSNRIMLGVETDANWANIYNLNAAHNNSQSSIYYTTTTSGPPSYSFISSYPSMAISNSSYQQTALNAIGTARFRLGYTFENLMPYVTGGVAYGVVSDNYKNTNIFAVNAQALIYGNRPPNYSSDSSFLSRVKPGWSAGAGVEYMLANNWSTKLEYLYTSIGPFSFGGPSGYSSFGVHQARFGLNYHLNLTNTLR